MFKKPINRFCGLVKKDGKILMMHSAARGWELPGITAEQSEGMTELLVNEIFEKTGITCQTERLSGMYRGTVDKTPVITMAFACKYISGEPTVSEKADDIRWVDPDEAPDMVTDPETKEQIINIINNDNSMLFSANMFGSGLI